MNGSNSSLQPMHITQQNRIPVTVNPKNVIYFVINLTAFDISVSSKHVQMATLYLLLTIYHNVTLTFQPST